MSQEPEQEFSLRDKAVVSLIALIPFSLAAACIAAVVYVRMKRPITGRVATDVAFWAGALGLYYVLSLVMMLPSWNIQPSQSQTAV